jgi:hypothetical protein
MLIFLRDFGGLLIDWSLQISPDVDAADMHSLFTGDWCLSRESFSKEFGGGLFPIMSAPRNAPWIQLAADVFENESWGGVNECPVGGGFKVYEHATFQPFTDNVCDNALHFFVDADDPRRPIIAAPNISSRERLGSWMDGFLNILPGWQPIPANGNIPIDVVVSTISGKYGYPIRSNCDVYLNQTGFVSVLHPISLLP